MRIAKNEEKVVTCKICGREMVTILSTHLLKHGVSRKEYLEKFPGSKFHSQKRRIDCRLAFLKGSKVYVELLKTNTELMKKRIEIGRKCGLAWSERCRKSLELSDRRASLMSQSITKYNEDYPEAAAAHGYLGILSQVRNRGGSCVSKLEFRFENILKELKLSYTHQYRIGKYICDFFISKLNLIVEVQGDYWHNLPHIIRKDSEKFNFLKEKGYNIIFIPESLLLHFSNYVKKLILEAIDYLQDVVRIAKYEGGCYV